MATDKQNALSKARAWKLKNKAHVREYQKKWRAENSEHARKYHKKWCDKNRNLKHGYDAAWKERNKEAIIAKRATPHAKSVRNEKERLRYRQDAKYRMEKCLRAAVTQAVRLQRAKKSCQIKHLIGCSSERLVEHIGRQFLPSMSWENYATTWEIDHIRPCASFDLSDPEEQKACFHFTNLRPYEKQKNRKKSAKRLLII
jgi:hypothetical protein